MTTSKTTWRWAILLAALLATASAAEEWRVARFPAEGVVIRHRPGDEGALPQIVEYVGLARERFAALADTFVPVQIRVIAATSRGDFSRLTGGIIPEWGAAVAFPDELLVVVALREGGEKPLAFTLPHEVSHVLLGAVAREDVPRWFDEGLAMYLANEWNIGDSFTLARGALGGGFLPLHRIDDVLSFRADRAWLAYAESFAAVSWFAERHGQAGLSLFVRRLARMPFEDAFLLTAGMSADEFESDWLSRTRTRYGLVALADDTWIWSLVIPFLFVVALAARAWRNHRKMRAWAAEEKREDDDEDPDEPLDERIADTYG